MYESWWVEHDGYMGERDGAEELTSKASSTIFPITIRREFGLSVEKAGPLWK